MSNCIFCMLANGEISANTVFENSDFRVILDASPANPGHMLVIPKTHGENIFELDTNLVKEAFALAKKMAEKLKDLGLADGVNILQNNGEAASQTVMHFHIHVIPRKINDNVTIKSEKYEMTEAETEEIRNKLALS